MNQKSDLALRTKIILSTIPMLIGVGFASYKIHSLFSRKDPRLQEALDLTRLANEAAYQTLEMSTHLKSYLMEPKNPSHFKNKKAADKAFESSMNRLDTLTHQWPEMTQLSREMANFDETQLDRTEDKVGDLVQKGEVAEATRAYQTSYLPLYFEQQKRFQTYTDLIRKKSNELQAQIEADAHQNGMTSIIWILSSLAFGLLGIFWITRLTIKTLSKELGVLGSASQNLSASCQKLGGASAGLSQSTLEQASAIQESVSALSEITSMIQQTSQNVGKSLQVSQNVDDRSQVGKEIMKRMVDSMNAIDQTSKSLQNIAQIIQTIHIKTGVINDIVFKTQLLSFNASIEAARAGQYGKGFAVVAEEVGNLAQMSGSSAEEIEALLADSQKQVDSALSMIRQRVGESKVVTDESVRTFSEIAEGIREITVQIKNISDATAQQSIGIGQTQKALSQLDIMARRNSETAQLTLKSTQSVAGIASELDSSRRSLQNFISGDSNTETPSVTPERTHSYSHPLKETSATLPISEESSSSLSSDDSSFQRAA
jgi:methyl-accepting chemotaxis protein